MSLNVDQIVSVSASISPTGLLRRDFGRTLFLTTDNTIPASERFRTYPLIADLAADFSAGDAPYDAGSIYFQQVPHPKNLIVGRWFNAVEDGYLLGGTGHGTLAQFTAISDGSLKFTAGIIGGYQDDPTDEEVTVSGIDLSTAVSLSEVATLVETAVKLAAPEADYTIEDVVYDAVAGGFKITWSAVVSTDITGVTYLEPTGSGTDLSALLALDSQGAAAISPSTVIEDITDALDDLVALDGSFYFITADNGINDTAYSDAISTWTGSRVYMYSADSSDAATLAKNDSVFTRLAALAPSRTFGTWSRTADHKGLSAAGRLSSVNFNATNSQITLKFKEMPGTLPDATMTPTQAAALQDQQVNFYSERSGDPMYEEGYTFNPDVWVDVRYWLDWFVNSVQTELYNVLKGTPTKVPQTEAGMNALKGAVTAVCKQGVSNGGIAGGTLSAALTLDVVQSTGNSSFDGTLDNGYLVYADTIASLPQSERAQRKAPPIKVWLKGSGAIHFVDVIVTFEN